MAPTPSAQRLRRGLPGYLILFAPHAFAPQRQYRPRDPPSPPVFLLISAHFTATPGIPVSPTELQPARIGCKPTVELRVFTADATSRLRALYAQSIRTTLAPYVLPRLLARSWPALLLQVPSVFVPAERGLQPESLHPPRGVAASGFRPLRKIPYCCLP